MTTDPETRAAFIAGLLDLACFLEAHPDAPVPMYGTSIGLATNGTEAEDRQAVEEFAAVFGVTLVDDWDTTGHYTATAEFGPVAYSAAAVSKAGMARHYAFHSYFGSVQPASTGEAA